MTVATAYSVISSAGNGVTTAFSVTWPFFAATDLVVTLVSSTGAETVKTLTTHYTVSGGTDVNGLPAVGTVTMLTAPASGETLRIQRSTSKVQSSNWTNGGSFQAKTVEATVDRLMLIAQEGTTGGGGDAITGDVMQFISSGADPDYWDAEDAIIRNVADPVADDDAVPKGYADTNYGGASAAAAAASATSASASATSAASSATSASASATSAAAAWDAFDDLYLGAKASDPLVDNDGAALTVGVMYFNTGSDELRIYDGAAWITASVTSVDGSTGAVVVSATKPVATRTALKALDTANYTAAVLMESGREGVWVWRTGNFAAHIAADTFEGLYAKADAISSGAGAWVRSFDGPVAVKWFGAYRDGITSDTAIIESVFTVVDDVLGGGSISMPTGDYLIDDTITVTLSNAVDVTFQPGARLVAATGLAETVLDVSAATAGTGSVTLHSPNIDCSDGTYTVGAQSCTAFSVTDLDTVIVDDGTFYGGDTYDADTADCAITSVNVRYMRVSGGTIKGFSDAGIYPNGGNDTGATDDGVTCIIEGVLFEHCNAVVTAKRQLNHLIFSGNVVSYCNAGVMSSWITSPSVVPPARRIDVIGNRFLKMRSQAIDFRGNTIGSIVGNYIEDFGYESDGVTETAGVVKAINIQGSSGVSIVGNTIAMNDWTATDHVGIGVLAETVDAVTYTPTGTMARGNAFVGLFRAVSETSTGANFYLDCTMDTVAQPSSTLNAASVLTYMETSGTVSMVQINGVTYRAMTGPATTTDNGVPRFDSTSGLVQTSGVTIDDNGVIYSDGAANPGIRLREGGSTTSYTHVEDTSATQAKIEKFASSGAVTFDINARPSDGTSAASFRFFRETSTSGNVSFVGYKGDGTSTANFQFGGNVASYVCSNNSNFGVGESSPDYKLDVNGTFGFTPGASVTPVDNGDVVFELTSNTSLTIKAKGSDGTVRSVALTMA